MELYKKFQAWPDLSKPPFSEIKEIGCCTEHEEDFLWYREHSWQDLFNLIFSDKEILDHIIDTISFISLEPRVHRYFMKAGLSALAKMASKAKNFEELDYSIWLWVSKNKENVEELKNWDGFHSVYSKEQVENIIELIEIIYQLPYEEDDRFLRTEEIGWTLEFWKIYKDKVAF